MFRLINKIRIVPLVIFASVLMLTFKVNDILNGIGPSLDSFFDIWNIYFLR